MKLTVVYDATSISQPLTGVGSYALNVLRRLIVHHDIEQIKCISGSKWVCPHQIVELAGYPTGNVLLNGLNIWCKSWLKKTPHARSVVNTFRRNLLLRTMNTLKDAVLFEPNYIVSNKSLPYVPVIHDLSHMHFPDFHPRERVSWMQKHLASTIASASALITVSEHSLNDIVQKFGVSREKIMIAPPGVNEAFFSEHNTNKQKVLERYKLQQGYLLTVGAIEPRKNLQGLLYAYLDLPPELRARHPLVVVGPLGWQYSVIAELASKCADVIFLGYVPEEDLPSLYSGAHGFAYPSFFEGFGIPLLEAMAAGTPVLTSNCSSMPEVTGPFAIYVDPNDRQDLVNGLVALVEDESFRQKVVNSGAERARGFSWDDSVERILESLFVARGNSFSSL